MFQAKIRDNDSAYRTMAGYPILIAINGIGLTKAPVYRRKIPVGNDRKSRELANATGQTGSHWPSFIEEFEAKSKTSFCKDCNSQTCVLNREQICRILIFYNLSIKLHMFYDEIYVSDFVEDEEIEKFLGFHVRVRPGSNRFVKVAKQTIPTFRDLSDSVYQGDNIDLTKLTRPNRQNNPSQ